MALRSREILDKFKNKFALILESKFCVFKTPTNLYENLVNTVAVARKLGRKIGSNSKSCEIEIFYKELKRENFPDDVIEAELNKACKNVAASLSAKEIQKIFSSFFSSRKSAPVVTEAETERSEPEENCNDEPKY